MHEQPMRQDIYDKIKGYAPQGNQAPNRSEQGTPYHEEYYGQETMPEVHKVVENW